LLLCADEHSDRADCEQRLRAWRLAQFELAQTDVAATSTASSSDSLPRTSEHDGPCPSDGDAPRKRSRKTCRASCVGDGDNDVASKVPGVSDWQGFGSDEAKGDAPRQGAGAPGRRCATQAWLGVDRVAVNASRGTAHAIGVRVGDAVCTPCGWRPPAGTADVVAVGDLKSTDVYSCGTCFGSRKPFACAESRPPASL